MIWNKVKPMLNKVVEITEEELAKARKDYFDSINNQVVNEQKVESNRKGFKPRPQIHKEIRYGIMRAGDGKCHYGGGLLRGYYRGQTTGYYFEIDHKHPKSKGGTDDVNNLVACCKKHNLEKGVLDYADYLKILKQNPALKQCGNAEYRG